jgi:hypothetical protein
MDLFGPGDGFSVNPDFSQRDFHFGEIDEAAEERSVFPIREYRRHKEMKPKWKDRCVFRVIRRSNLGRITASFGNFRPHIQERMLRAEIASLLVLHPDLAVRSPGWPPGAW